MIDLWGIICDFFSSFCSSLINDFLTTFSGIVGDLLSVTFFIETLPGLNETVLSTSIVNRMVNALYAVMLVLLTLKLLWKGSKVYIFWRDGEAENSPGEMLLGACFAIGTAVAFPILYKLAVNAIKEIAQTVLQYIGWDNPYVASGDLLGSVVNTFTANYQTGFVFVALLIAYIILLLCLIFKMLKQGAELLILRLGVPLAVVGLIDSDGGMWKSYCQVLFRCFATNLMQYVCMVIGVYLIAELSVSGIFLGIVFEICAFGAPKLLSQFMVTGGGGGSKIHTIAMVASRFIA